MFDFDGEKRRSPIIRLQLAPMIDIFTLIIVFLMKGAILEETAIQRPDNVNMAQSKSHETSEVAPQVIITDKDVQFRMINETRPIAEFTSDDVNPRDPMFHAFKDFIEKNKDIESTNHINVISDRATSYKIVYNVVRVLRLSGFQSILFVAEGDQ